MGHAQGKQYNSVPNYGHVYQRLCERHLAEMNNVYHVDETKEEKRAKIRRVATVNRDLTALLEADVVHDKKKNKYSQSVRDKASLRHKEDTAHKSQQDKAREELRKRTGYKILIPSPMTEIDVD